MSELEFHQAVYTRNGEYVGSSDHNWNPIRWWCDSWWDVAYPLNTTGFTYMDVGSAEGLYPLRFAQRGGVGRGINPDSPYQVEATARLRSMYPEFDFSVG